MTKKPLHSNYRQADGATCPCWGDGGCFCHVPESDEDPIEIKLTKRPLEEQVGYWQNKWIKEFALTTDLKAEIERLKNENKALRDSKAKLCDGMDTLIAAGRKKTELCT